MDESGEVVLFNLQVMARICNLNNPESNPIPGESEHFKLHRNMMCGVMRFCEVKTPGPSARNLVHRGARSPVVGIRNRENNGSY